MTDKINDDIIYGGVDDGHDETKVVLSNGFECKIKSQAKSGELNQISIGDSDKTVFSYQTNKGEYIIGDIRESDVTSFDDYPISAMNRVIVTHALRKAGLKAGQKVSICSGLPINRFYKGGEINQKLVKAKKANLLTNDVYSNDGQLLHKIVNHDVVSEGIAAWFDIIFERQPDNSLVKNEQKVMERIAIIDIGGRTTDIAVIKAGNLDRERSGTIDIGNLNVRESVFEMISDKFDGISATNEQMNEVMTDGRIKLWGQYHSVSIMLENSRRMIASRIEAKAKKLLGSAADIDRVVFVGGTVIDLTSFIVGWFKNQEIASNPGKANANGMCKFSEVMALTK
ncbi:ParM/StbA family protein [Psychromonas sp. SP041]|uniref:ParM/StbA family protein n=1 Tax=Psychromonas sp. SP041 TaxID=1365007 RepID=UPI0010C79A86|nr:ParM/StbA family protein [Psychromonas sp. SP041]